MKDYRVAIYIRQYTLFDCLWNDKVEASHLNSAINKAFKAWDHTVKVLGLEANRYDQIANRAFNVSTSKGIYLIKVVRA